MTSRLNSGVRVRVKNTALYNGRVGILLDKTEDPDNFWDFSCLLDATTVPEGSSRIQRKLYGERLIGVNSFQIEII